MNLFSSMGISHGLSGLTALIALGILDNLEEQGKIRSLLEMEHNSAEYLHALVETLRHVYAHFPFLDPLNDPSQGWHLQTRSITSLIPRCIQYLLRSY